MPQARSAHARCRIFAFGLLISAFLLVPAPARGGEAPDLFVDRYIAATRAMEWDSVAAMMHSTALSDFKQLMRPAVIADSSGEMSHLLFDVVGAAAYDSLPPARVFSRLMRSLVTLNPLMGEALAGAEAKVIGAVPEGDDLVHVIYRIGVGVGVGDSALAVTKLEVISLRREAGGWRSLLTGNVQGLAEVLRQSVGASGP
ncbi:MAG: hypothetical protein IT349_17860 [Candidatus Eisenbacteria bacterium]|nr:hypothetical protein [Candidatus Eisenbacteria bacterium]